MYNKDADRFHSRKSPRIKEFDYCSPNFYFITICTHNKVCLFGQPMQLNPNGIIAQQGFDQIGQHFPDVKVEKYVIMPNHVHAIIQLKDRK